MLFTIKAMTELIIMRNEETGNTAVFYTMEEFLCQISRVVIGGSCKSLI